jgi:hypothetical protein
MYNPTMEPPNETPRRESKLPVFATGIAMAVSVGAALVFRQPQAAKPLRFEVASVKMSAPENNHPQGFRLPSAVIRGISGNRLTESHITLIEIVMQAYDVRDYQIAGMPGWGEWRGERFDVIAKADGGGIPPASPGPPDVADTSGGAVPFEAAPRRKGTTGL